MKTYNVAIVGCGPMGVENFFDDTIPYTYSFAGAVLKNTGTILTALVDKNEAKLKEVARKLTQRGYSGFSIYTSLDEAITKSKHNNNPIHIVCCAAGPSVNSAVIHEAKHNQEIQGVYCEKPLALSLDEADALAEIEQKSHLKIQVNYLRNHDSHHRAIINFIREGGIGKLLLVRTLYKRGIIGVFPHTSALLGILFDKPLSVSGIYSPLLNTTCLEDPNIDGIVTYFYAPENRAINVHVGATWSGKTENMTYIYEFEFTGTNGRISILENGFRLRYERMEPMRFLGHIQHAPYDTAKSPLELTKDIPFKQGMTEGLQRLIHAIETNTPASCSAANARDAEEIAHALAISASLEGKIVQFPMTDRIHAFTNSRTGINILKEEAGMKD